MRFRSGGRVRSAIAGVALTTAVAVGAIAAPSAVAAPEADSATAPTWAPADSAAIRPGVQTETVGGRCTANFVYTSGERTFLGSAAHCAADGGAGDLDGCETPSLPLGTPVSIRGFDGGDRAGTLAYSSWLAMQEVGETDEDTCFFNDFALIELAPADVADVNPSVPVFGGPTGLDTDGVSAGEQIFSYGNSPTRSGIDAISPKVGVSAGSIGGGFAHTYFSFTPDVPGDSGNGVLDSDGEAVGALSRLNILAPPATPGASGATDVAMALAYAQRHGGLAGLTLEPGTEPFTSSPVGLSPLELAAPAGPPLLG